MTEVVEGIDFPGILKKEHMEIPGVNSKEVEFQGVFMKNSWNFHGSWFLTLEFPATRAVTQFCRICRDESLFSKSNK